MTYYNLPPTKFANEFNDFEKSLRALPASQRNVKNSSERSWRDWSNLRICDLINDNDDHARSC